MRFVFCPHGNSDKGHSLQNHVQQDVSLVYGDHLLALLEQSGAAEKIRHIVRTGNYRYHYYLEHKEFFDALAEEKVFSRFKKEKPVVLYAPTWSDSENPGSFFSATDRLIEELSGEYNILIKLHPFLMEHHPAHTYALTHRYETHECTFPERFPSCLSPFGPKCPLLGGLLLRRV